jgi:CheY-like chemotaxis protein
MKVPADEPQSATGGVAAGDVTGTAARPAHSALARSAVAVALAELRLQLEAWERHEPGARFGADAEELHQLRVAVRRIDAIFGLFKQHLPPDLVRSRSTTKGILRTLGAARDFDVQLAELDRYCESLSATERLTAAPLRARLQADRAQARALLTAAGYEVVGEAADGESGVRVARDLAPDLVLLDVQLPDITGFEVVRRVHSEPDPPAIVLISSRDASDYGRRIGRSGALGFISKADLSAPTLRAVLEGGQR